MARIVSDWEWSPKPVRLYNLGDQVSFQYDGKVLTGPVVLILAQSRAHRQYHVKVAGITYETVPEELSPIDTKVNTMPKDPLYHDFHEFKKLMVETTENLKKMEEMQRDMRWQFGEPKEFTDFTQALDDTRDGWVSSNC